MALGHPMNACTCRGRVLALLPPLLLLICAGAALGGYCDRAYLWMPDGSKRQSKDWSSYAATSSFRMGPCLQVSGIGAQLTPEKTLLVLDRSNAVNTYAYLPGTSKLAFAEELSLATGDHRGLNMITNAFCSSGQFNATGTFFNFGGSATWGGYVEDGRGSVRGFQPCSSKRCQLYIAAEMLAGRWYATTQLLGDGRIIVVGGSKRGVGVNERKFNVPTVEYYPLRKGESAHHVQFLEDSLPYNLFAFVHLLPSGRLFIFAGNKYILFDTATNREVPGARPALQRANRQGRQVYRSYPLSGTSALLPLKSSNSYSAGIMICGGAGSGAKNVGGSDPLATADDMCYRIVPEADAPRWAATRMRAPRVMPLAVLLADGAVLIATGAQTGYAGLGRTCSNAVLQPELWDSEAHKWYNGPSLAFSRIPRVYHASATLVHDGSVLLTGSNPHSSIVIDDKDFPLEFRTEYFHPPYMAARRPVITRAPRTVRIGRTFSLSFKFSSSARVKVVLAHPGFSTHNANHGMRNVVLDVVRTARARGGGFTLQVKGPPSKNICPPTWYMLFVLVNGVPAAQARNIYVK